MNCVLGGLLMLVGLVSAQAFSAPPLDSSQKQSTPGEVRWLKTPHGNLKTIVYKSTHLSSHPILVVVLHGDLPKPPPKYQYQFAKLMAEENDDVVAAGVLRPAYEDPYGDRSDGKKFLATGDNYTSEVVDAIASSTDQLKSSYAARAVILVGHSGGAAIVGNLLGRRPGSADAAILVACVCDLVAWRERMRHESVFPGWRLSVRSLAPLDLVSQVSPLLRIDLIVGANDSVAIPEYTHRYYAALRSYHVNASEFVLPNLEHNILLEPSVVEHARQFIAAYARSTVSLSQAHHMP